MWTARYCHRDRRPVQNRPAAGFWSRLLGDLFHTPELRPLATRYDCLRGCPRPLRFLRPRSRDGGSDGRLMLLFEFDGVDFEVDAMRADGMVVAEAVTLPQGAALDEQHLVVPELVSEEALDCPERAEVEGRGGAAAAAAAPAVARAVGSGGGGGLQVGCINTQQAIEAAETVGGSSFAELSARMQPLSSSVTVAAGCADPWKGEHRDYSVAGFLKRGVGLKAQLLADNAVVLEQLAVPSHQALVGPLLKAARLLREAHQRLGKHQPPWLR